ncbi:hypothetical protein [Euzebya sp.]|uniref:hypothetical protein n=1 Tax=Euzebya sp. TaxID=1971409 RepID=UPI003516A52B
MTVDPYAPNPYAALLARLHPERYAEVAAVAPPPRLFEGGRADLPATTASGVDPQVLMRLPFGLRHAAAAEPDRAKVFELVELYADVPDAQIDHPRLGEAWQRMQRWLHETDTDPRSFEQRQADDDAEFASYYPEAS